jgi:hypothetical protein
LGPLMIKSRVEGAARRIQAVPYVVWILLGFLPGYVWFFLWPVFFSGPVMNPLHEIVPFMSPIGADLRQTMRSVQGLFYAGVTPYIGDINYPPLTFVLLGPFLLVGNSVRYVVMSAITLVSYGIATVAFPLTIRGEKRLPAALMLVLITGVLSYALQFELERAQFNVLSGLLAYAAIWIFHRHPRGRLWAYALFCLSVQLKLYTFVFVFMLIQDWRDWRANLRRIGLLVLANIGLTFILGPRIFMDFVSSIFVWGYQPSGIRPDNGSIFSFANLFVRSAARSQAWLSGAAPWLEVALLALVGLCLSALVWRAYRQNVHGVDPHLLVGCTIAAIVVPALSYDYKLTLLAGPTAILLLSLGEKPPLNSRGIPLILAVMLFSFAYCLTLFSPGYKPGILVLHSNFPALMTMLFTVIWMARLTEPAAGESPSEPGV